MNAEIENLTYNKGNKKNLKQQQTINSWFNLNVKFPFYCIDT